MSSQQPHDHESPFDRLHRDPHTMADLETNLPIEALAKRLTTLWDNGWHPLEVARLVNQNDEGSIDLMAPALASAISLDRLGWHPRAASLWAQQADELGAGPPWWDVGRPFWPQFAEQHGGPTPAMVVAMRALDMTLEFGRQQPLLEAPPTQAGWEHGAATTDDRVLAKVRALLAKAESTEFEHEAEALSAKAQTLIARYSIDVALLASDVDVPGGRRVYLDAPYTKPKFLLLANIADANGCRTCWYKYTNTATLIGHQNDLHLVVVLYTSLLLQGTRAVLAAGPQTDGWTSTTRSWRNAFWLGYASRIGQRLKEATPETRYRHRQTTGVDLVPVMARRDAEVERKFDETFPNLSTMRTSVSNGEGLAAGRRFADRAQLNANHTVGGDRPQLTG